MNQLNSQSQNSSISTQSCEEQQIPQQHFTQNTLKCRNLLKLFELGQQYGKDCFYLGANNAIRPDLMISNCQFLRGSDYTKYSLDWSQRIVKSKSQQKYQEFQASQQMQEEECDDRKKLMKSRYRSRYFQEYDLDLVCTYCNEYGHVRGNCFQLNFRPICLRCQNFNHDFEECQQHRCSRCANIGHSEVDCKVFDILQCKKCQLNGHLDDHCMLMRDFIKDQRIV
ncbi:zcchc7l protein [Stylonychia lemnae]|uniref:Zcchc7l protein n=1 Tax=Stylonychia lemnae TaxID=5949 RepID=A0A078B3H9_STYLE|nr:zcchc7l protein [Stylonychia lemnae]|eukprot:CDW87787.1 zcchc7l protein [Stylonychia lemnae]